MLVFLPCLFPPSVLFVVLSFLLGTWVLCVPPGTCEDSRSSLIPSSLSLSLSLAFCSSHKASTYKLDEVSLPAVCSRATGEESFLFSVAGGKGEDL